MEKESDSNQRSSKLFVDLWESNVFGDVGKVRRNAYSFIEIDKSFLHKSTQRDSLSKSVQRKSDAFT